tara:strand:- start:138 stop:449 length:312 start_codon:yes stop_codon:yes gene_type:complete
MVNSNTRGGGAWFDIKGIQNTGLVDSKVRELIMSQFAQSIRLVSPADVVNLGLGLSSTPGVDMSGDSGELIAEMQATNTELAKQNQVQEAKLKALLSKQGRTP